MGGMSTNRSPGQGGPKDRSLIRGGTPDPMGLFDKFATLISSSACFEVRTLVRVLATVR